MEIWIFLLEIVNNNRPHMKKSKGKYFAVELKQPEMSVRPLMIQTFRICSQLCTTSLFFRAFQHVLRGCCTLEINLKLALTTVISKSLCLRNPLFTVCYKDERLQGSLPIAINQVSISSVILLLSPLTHLCLFCSSPVWIYEITSVKYSGQALLIYEHVLS